MLHFHWGYHFKKTMSSDTDRTTYICYHSIYVCVSTNGIKCIVCKNKILMGLCFVHTCRESCTSQGIFGRDSLAKWPLGLVCKHCFTPRVEFELVEDQTEEEKISEIEDEARFARQRMQTAPIVPFKARLKLKKSKSARK